MRGQRYRVQSPIYGIGIRRYKRSGVTIPYGETVRVVSEPHSGGLLLDLLWNDRIVAVFLADLRQRCVAIAGPLPVANSRAVAAR